MFIVAVACVVLLLLGLRLLRWMQASATIPSLHTRHILITGCDTGFGRRLARRLDKMGCHVTAACLTSSAAGELSEECSGRLRTVLLDVTKDEDIERAVKDVRRELPEKRGLWAVVNNAGVFGPVGTAEMITRDQFLHTLQVNVLGVAMVTKAFLPLVRRERGRVVNVTSVAGRFAMSPTPYVASKFAVVGYTEMLRRELYNHVISVHSIEPGLYSNTNLMGSDVLRRSANDVYHNSSDYVKRLYGQHFVHNLMQRMEFFINNLSSGNPEEVVDAVVHALTSRRPSDRYTVGLNGRFIFRPLSLIPTGLADWLVTRGLQKPNDVSDL